MMPTVHIRAERDKPLGIPTALCGVGTWSTAFRAEGRPATCRACLDISAESKNNDKSKPTKGDQV